MKFANGNFNIYLRPASYFLILVSQLIRHEKQNNAIVKGDVGEINLTEDPFQTMVGSWTKSQ